LPATWTENVTYHRKLTLGENVIADVGYTEPTHRVVHNSLNYRAVYRLYRRRFAAKAAAHAYIQRRQQQRRRRRQRQQLRNSTGCQSLQLRIKFKLVSRAFKAIMGVCT